MYGAIECHIASSSLEDCTGAGGCHNGMCSIEYRYQSGTRVKRTQETLLGALS